MSEAVPEGKSIEYKEVLPGDTNEAKKEFLADVASFANASGGDIVYGVIEKREGGKATGLPDTAVGLAGINPDAAIARLHNMIRDGISPRVAGVEAKPIGGFANGAAIVLRVPKSWTGAHMVGPANSSRFFSRNTNGKYPMDVNEIRSAFIFSEELPARIRTLRSERLGQIVAGESALGPVQNGVLILHLIPASIGRADFQLDVRALRAHRSRLFPLGHDYSEATRFNIDGYLTTAGRRDAVTALSYAQVFRDGVIEAADARRLEPFQGRRLLFASAIEEILVKSIPEYLAALQAVGVQPPLFVLVSLVLVKNYQLWTDPGRSHVHTEAPVDKEYLLLPEIQLESLDGFSPKLLKPLFDALWQSCGWPGSPNFDDNGIWVEK